MAGSGRLFTPREAAQILGISYPTLKQWIYKRKIRTIRTAGGHHRIPEKEINQYLKDIGRSVGPPWTADQKLAMLAGCLAAPGPVPAQGVAMVSQLLADGTGPLYREASADDLGGLIGEATRALTR